MAPTSNKAKRNCSRLPACRTSTVLTDAGNGIEIVEHEQTPVPTKDDKKQQMISMELATLPARDPSIVEPVETSKQVVNPTTPRQQNVNDQNIINHLHLMQSASH